MGTRLTGLLNAIEKVTDDVDRRADSAFNCFPMPAPVLTQWSEYEECLSVFYCQIESAILGLHPCRPVDLRRDFSCACRSLQGKFGGDMRKGAFELARTGEDGGLLGVLRTLLRSVAEEQAGNQVAALVHTYWMQRSAEELLADSAEYLATYGHLIPTELTEGSAGRIRVNFIKVLKEHPRMIQRMQRIGQQTMRP